MTISVVVVRSQRGRAAADGLAAIPPAEGHEVVDRLAVESPAGFAVAVTQGMAGARGRFVLVLSSDVELEPGWADPLVALLDAHPEVAAVAPQTRNGDGTLVTPSPLAALGRVDEEELDTAPFGCLLVRRSAFVAIGAIEADAGTPAEAGAALARAWADAGFRGVECLPRNAGGVQQTRSRGAARAGPVG